MQMKRNIPRSTWIPCLLLVYLAGMTAFFAPELIRTGETTRLIVVFCSELLLIALVYFFLKKREEQNK